MLAAWTIHKRDDHNDACLGIVGMPVAEPSDLCRVWRSLLMAVSQLLLRRVLSLQASLCR